MAVGLVYVGRGAFVPDVPARDLNADEVARYGGVEALVATGLYQLPQKPDVVGGRQNKIVGPREEK